MSLNRRRFCLSAGAAAAVLAAPSLLRRAAQASENSFRVRYYPVAAGMRSRDVTAAPDGAIWFCGQQNGMMGRLDPRDGSYKLVSLGNGAAPHGVVLGPDNALWITEGGQNAIARLDLKDHKVRLFKLPESVGYANLNTGVFDKRGIYWFTGQSGIYGRFDPKTEEMTIFEAPRGRGPYGITCTPAGDVWYASLAGNFIGKIDLTTGKTTIVEPPTKNQGARRVWSDSKGRLWVSEWNSGNVSVHDPAHGSWRTWKLCPESGRAAIRSMWMRRTSSGSPILPPMPSCASTRRPKNSSRSRAACRTPTCVRWTAVRARPGAASPAPTAWSWSRPLRRHEPRRIVDVSSRRSGDCAECGPLQREGFG